MSTMAADVTMLQSGTVSVGSNPGNNLAKVSVTFQPAFPATPVVTANTIQGPDYHGKPITDTFAVSITSVSTTGFTANVYRVDNILGNVTNPSAGGGWWQQLQLGWMAYSG